MDKYIVLTNKETFQTKVDSDGLEAIETYKINLYEKYEGKEYVNNIRVKFFETFNTIEEAREELDEIVKASGNSEDSKFSRLVKAESAVV